MKRWYVHGTSYESAKSMISKNPNTFPRTWDCSGYDCIYVRCIDKTDIYDNNLLDAFNTNTYKEFINETLLSALNNACISAAHQNSQSELVALMFFYIDDDIIEPDCSCNNMDNSYYIDADKFKETYRFVLYCNAYIPLYRAFYLKNLSQELLNIDELNVSVYEKALMDLDADISFIYDLMFETQHDSLHDDTFANTFLYERSKHE